MTSPSVGRSHILPMAAAGTTDNLGSDSSTNERYDRSDVMNPILVQQMAQYRMNTLDREAERNAQAALARSATVRRSALRERVGRTAARLHLFRWSAA
jgi:hypothetical protein